MSSRAEIRSQIRARRRALDPAQRRRAALEMARRAVRSRPFLNSDRIAFYLPNDGELDTALLLQRAWRLGKRCYLPVLDSGSSNRLWFVRYRPGDRLVLNRFGIPEPAAVRRRVSARRLDLILMPLVAFDPAGNRLGMGGGYYDRTLAFLGTRRHWRRPLLCGVAYGFQRRARIAAQSWDVPLDGVLTEHGLSTFPRSGDGGR